MRAKARPMAMVAMSAVSWGTGTISDPQYASARPLGRAVCSAGERRTDTRESDDRGRAAPIQEGPMDIGVVFPQVEIGPDPAKIRDYAQAVEGMGYTHVLAFDHVLGANPERPGGWKGPYTYRHAFHEP